MLLDLLILCFGDERSSLEAKQSDKQVIESLNREEQSKENMKRWLRSGFFYEFWTPETKKKSEENVCILCFNASLHFLPTHQAYHAYLNCAFMWNYLM